MSGQNEVATEPKKRTKLVIHQEDHEDEDMESGDDTVTVAAAKVDRRLKQMMLKRSLTFQTTRNVWKRAGRRLSGCTTPRR